MLIANNHSGLFLVNDKSMPLNRRAEINVLFLPAGQYA
ncbi:hypothetical protein D083_2172 [Dickeya solani RNS 08.23.3.1.A]|nr:hypothetical protein D083_2172 [Dickeya solani RNS 08.23.3.1.A]